MLKVYFDTVYGRIHALADLDTFEIHVDSVSAGLWEDLPYIDAIIKNDGKNVRRDGSGNLWCDLITNSGLGPEYKLVIL